MSRNASNKPAAVAEEERLLETVLTNLRRLRSGPMVADHAAELMRLRDSLSEEKLPEDIASIMEAMDRTAALMSQQAQETGGHVDLDSPYFGHLVVDDTLGKRSILIGKSTFISDRVRIVDWRNAPISRIFYQYAEGDEYDEEIADRDVSGSVLLRRTLSISEGRLERVTDDEHTWVRHEDDAWEDLRGHEARLSGGAGAAIRPSSLGSHGTFRRDKHLPEITSLLDPRQFKLITGRDSGVVVIQGSAGSGKTTVGLHRIAYLAFAAPGDYRPDHMVVIVFSRALAAYIGKVLPALGVEGVEVLEYEPWARALRLNHFKGTPEAYNDDTPALVTRFKTHTAMLRMVDEIGRRNRGGNPLALFEDMLTDRPWIVEGLERWAPGEFSDAEITKIHRWCTNQHFVRAEGGGALEHEKPAFDREDDTILLRLHQIMRGPLRAGKRQLHYDHIMVDEAQDLSPIELAVVMHTAGRRQSVTLAGDVAQKIAEYRDFQNWTQVLGALGLEHVDISPLQVSYRSTRQIMEVARDILGPLAPSERVATTREGAPVGHLRFGSDGEAVAWLAPALADLLRREPTANVALLTATMPEAIAWWQALDRAEVPRLRLVDDQDFAFAPGIEVTDIRSSKGLEFDYVVVLGADAEAFPTTDAARHLLHVGATRAAHQLWLVSTSRPSPLIPTGLPGLL